MKLNELQIFINIKLLIFYFIKYFENIQLQKYPSEQSMKSSVTSSAGFKKRLLRPVSQHQGEKELSIGLLKNIDLTLAQSTLDNISTNNLELFNKYIQSLDIDKSIRKKKTTLTQSGFSFNNSNGVIYLKDWIIKENNVKIPENKENQDIDVQKILTKIGCQNVETGFKKTYKCLQYFDKIVTKSCQSLVIEILKYHQTYVTQIQSDDKESYKLFLQDLTLSSMDNGLFLIKLLPIFMSRQGNIFSKLIKSTKQKKSSFSINGSQLNEQKQQTYRQTCQKLQQLIKQNCELKGRQDKIEVELQKIKIQKAFIQEMKSKSSYLMIEKYQKEMKELYSQQIKEITKEMDAQMSTNIALRTKIKQLQFQNKKYNQEKGKNSISKVKGTDFNEAMMQEFNKMRKGFEKKFQEMKQSSIENQKELRKELNIIRKNLQNVQWQKRVVLKKYEFLVTCE